MVRGVWRQVGQTSKSPMRVAAPEAVLGHHPDLRLQVQTWSGIWAPEGATPDDDLVQQAVEPGLSTASGAATQPEPKT